LEQVRSTSVNVKMSINSSPSTTGTARTAA